MVGFPRLISRILKNIRLVYPEAWQRGMGGRIIANGPPRYGFQNSAEIVIPANSIIVFAAR
jgi:hypothetical protein